jgi:hypothetical protein
MHPSTNPYCPSTNPYPYSTLKTAIFTAIINSAAALAPTPVYPGVTTTGPDKLVAQTATTS